MLIRSYSLFPLLEKSNISRPFWSGLIFPFFNLLTVKPVELFKNPVRSQWCGYIDGLQSSPQSLYALIKEAMNEKGFPNVSFKKVKHSQSGGLFSAKREYLRVRRKENYYDVCGASFGNSFFVSYWFFERYSLFHRIISAIPVVGKPLVLMLRKKTYYQEDEQAIFRSAAHDTILEIVKKQIEENGLRNLSEMDERPIQFDMKGRRI